MHWRLKCLAFHLEGLLPFRRQVHALLQRYVTASYWLNLSDQYLKIYQWHVDNYHGLRRPGRALEFGAGSDLLTPLLLSGAGAEVIYAYDLERIATVEQVNHVISQLRARQLPGDWPAVIDLDADLERRYRIRYCAPRDARATGLPASSVDFIYSTSTLEHIREEDIVRILEEGKRIGSPSSCMSFVIGYADHYANTDPSTTFFNFYRYHDLHWQLYNPRHHYQNRLRHSDFERIFQTAGLSIVTNRRIMSREPEKLTGIRLARQFRRYSREDLLTHDGLFVLRRENSSQQDHRLC